MSTCVAEPPTDSDDDLGLLGLQEEGWWVPTGEPVVDYPGPDPEENPIEDELNDHLRRAANDTELELPALPRVAQRALTMLRDEEVDYRRLSNVIQDDPAIAARVLRVVNSSAYSRMFKTNSTELAFVRLGRRMLHSIIMAMAVKDLTAGQSGPQRELAEQYWRQSIVSATLLGEMSRRYGLPEEEAFLIGLLHDIGRLAVLRILHTFQSAYRAPVSGALASRVCERWHEPLGHRLATAWRLQEPLPEIAGNHHHPPTDDDPWVRYRWLVQFTDAASSMMGYAPYVSYDFFNLPCVAALEIKDDADTRDWLSSFPALILDRAAIF